jgi:hypothetical protein
MSLHPDVQALSDAMHELEAFLRQHKVTYWAEKVARCVPWVDASDAYGIREFLSMFGGMGSINDTALAGPDDDQLRRLLSRAWEAAKRANSN